MVTFTNGYWTTRSTKEEEKPFSFSRALKIPSNGLRIDKTKKAYEKQQHTEIRDRRSVVEHLNLSRTVSLGEPIKSRRRYRWGGN